MATKQSKDTTTADQDTDGLAGDLPERVAEANEKGYWGEVTDPTPNEAYTLAGVTSGQPTPETDPDLQAEAERRAAELGAQGAGGGADNS